MTGQDDPVTPFGLLALKVDQIASDVLVIKTKLNFTYQVVFPMLIGAVSLVAGVFVGVLMVRG